MTDKEFANYDTMAEWIIFHKEMPDPVLKSLLEPYIPVEIDRENGVVVIYCEKFRVNHVRDRLREWGEEHEEKQRAVRAATSKERFEVWKATQDLHHDLTFR